MPAHHQILWNIKLNQFPFSFLPFWQGNCTQQTLYFTNYVKREIWYKRLSFWQKFLKPLIIFFYSLNVQIISGISNMKHSIENWWNWWNWENRGKLMILSHQTYSILWWHSTRKEKGKIMLKLWAKIMIKVYDSILTFRSCNLLFCSI